MTSTIRVLPCRSDDVPLLTAAEPSGARLAEQFFSSQQAGSIVYLVGWLDGVPAGTGVLTRGERPELKNLHTRAEFRGRGVGRALIAAAEQLAALQLAASQLAAPQSAAADGVLAIGVGVDNPDARRLYVRLGYRPTGRLTTTTYRYHDGEGVEREATETAEELEKPLR
ncbi:GNAT family N-acetyltransferase [Nakamurella lactea]|uniref:GNAT family N-acetyltransferase n=1 Tax=Nakamurella lactea TaxID=459515 RepID=UPI000406B5EC|nr:GNAT family N-acetyltransferase [Nakamurella lactea]